MKKEHLQFGMTRDGEWRSVYEVNSGKTVLICPWCKQSLMAKKGLIRAHHFAHTGDTCRVSIDAISQTQLPTFDTFELLDAAESKYMELRRRYGSHKNIYTFSGLDSALKRLEVMKLISFKYQENAELELTKLLLSKLEGNWLDAGGQPTKALLDMFNALRPIADLEPHWSSKQHIEEAVISNQYRKYQFNSLQTLSDLNNAQCFWFDAFWRRQAFVAPEHLEFLRHKLQALNKQSLYVMRFQGGFSAYPEAFIKIGMTTREPTERLKEVITALKPYGKNIKGELITNKENAGRIERLIHRQLIPSHLPVGRFREFFSEESLGPLLTQLDELQIEPYQPPAV